MSATTTYHVGLDVASALLNWSRTSHHGLTDGEGRPMANGEAKAELLELLGLGIRYLPVGPKCDAFDPTSGCPGHRESTDG